MIWKIYSNFGDVELCFGKFYPFCDATFPQLTCIIRTRLNHEEMRFLDFIRTLLPSPPSTLILSLLRRGGGHPTCRRGSLMGPFLRHRYQNSQGQAHCRCRKIIKTLLPSPLHTLLVLLLRKGGGTLYLQEMESDAPISQTSLPELLRTGSLPP